MKMRKFQLLLAAVLFLLCDLAYAAPKLRKIRIRFYGVSESVRSDTATNTNFASYKSTAAYDAVWENETFDDDFPNFFPPANVLTASGHNSIKSKDGTLDCEVPLSLDTNQLPGAEPYNFNGDIVTIRIPTPHSSQNDKLVATISNNGAPLGCRTPLYSYFANQDKTETVITDTSETFTTVTPPLFNLPPEPGTQTPVSRGNWAIIQVDIKKPDTSLSYTFEQRTSAGTEENTIRWKGFISVEADPKPVPPVQPVDPFIIIDKDPPFTLTTSVPVPEPDPTLPPLVEKLLGNIVDTIKSQAKEGATDPALAPAVIANEDGTQSVYSEDTNEITTTAASLVPESATLTGKFSVKNEGVEEPKVSKIKAIPLVAGTEPRITVKVPKPLVTALKKGLGSNVTVTLTAKPENGGKTINKSSSFKLKKRGKKKGKKKK